MAIVRLSRRVSSSKANKSSGSPKATSSVSPLSSSTRARKRRAADSGNSLTTSARKGKVLRLTNGMRNCRARPLAKSSSVMMPVSISSRPTFLPVWRCSARVCCSCSCEIRRCCTSTSPSRNFSGRPGVGAGLVGAGAEAAAMFMGDSLKQKTSKMIAGYALMTGAKG